VNSKITLHRRGRRRELPGQPGVLGLRFAFQTKKLMPLLTEGHAEWIWGEAQKLGLGHGPVALDDRLSREHRHVHRGDAPGSPRRI
jgi:hypothetical protein